MSLFYLNLKYLLFVSIYLFRLSLCGYVVSTKSSCDWIGSGLNVHKDKMKSVTAVYLNCREGFFSWSYPRGAVRVVLTIDESLPQFYGCLRTNEDFSNVRVYLKRTSPHLRLLLPAGRGVRGKQVERCFHSANGRAILYLESENGFALNKTIAQFSYFLEKTPPSNRWNALEGCRPCTDTEILKEYHFSDLAVSGSIIEVTNSEELQKTILSVLPTKVLRNKFLNCSRKRLSSKILCKKNPSIKVEDSTIEFELSKSCRAKYGPGQFVFIGKRRFDYNQLICVTSHQNWIKLVNSFKNHV